ncbi:MAG: DUF5615 family PIN-like protein [Magnetococcales bacterium]|nr:DUF5615 family PIN-like protein [Magnetococcales bacterium]
MRFKVDENLPSEVTILLQHAGHDALSILDQNMGGSDDGKIFPVRCRQQDRIQDKLCSGWVHPMGDKNENLHRRKRENHDHQT